MNLVVGDSGILCNVVVMVVGGRPGLLVILLAVTSVLEEGNKREREREMREKR